MGTPLLAAALNGVVLFGFERPALLPRVGHATLPVARALMASGALFFVLQVAIAVAYESDALVVSRVLGAKSVTQYAVPMRLFVLPVLGLGFLLSPLWPAYSEAVSRGDVVWVRRTLRRSLFLSGAGGAIMGLSLALSGRTLIHLWAGRTVTPSVLLLSSLACWTAVMSVSTAVAMFLNGLHILRLQAVCAAAMMVANLGLSIALTEAIGVSGVVWGTVIAQTLFVLIPIALRSSAIARQLDSLSEQSVPVPAEALAANV
jgi:O-antigen/teichoic acid export membrane protein